VPEFKIINCNRFSHVLSHLGVQQINPGISLYNLICQEKAMDVDCPGSLVRALSIVLQQNGELVVLVQDALLDIVPLFFHEEFGPKDHLWHIVGTHWTFCCFWCSTSASPKC